MKKISFCLFCFAFALLIAGCFNPVFYNIRREVELASATVSGTVNSIARFTSGGKEFLVTQSGSSVFYKPLDKERTGDSSVWTVRGNSTFDSLEFDFFEAEYDGEYITKLAVDSNYIYLLTVCVDVRQEKGEAIITEKKLYFTDSLTGNSWTKIDVSAIKEDYKISIENSSIFCTNAIETSGRKAYFRNGADLYELNGSAVPVVVDKATYKIPDVSKKDDESLASASERAVLNSAVWFGGNVLFFETLASVTNETADDAATMYYYGDSNGIHYSNADGSVAGKSDASDGDITCLAVAKDCLLFGKGDPHSANSTGGGIYKTLLVNGVPENKTAGFSTNADAAITSAYQVLTLLVSYPSKPELENSIYASTNFKTTGSSISVSYDNVCLWAYYPKRGNWNRE